MVDASGYGTPTDGELDVDYVFERWAEIENDSVAVPPSPYDHHNQ